MEVYKTPCKNCLFTKNRIVSMDDAMDILKDCSANQTHFICHKATQEGKDICCKGFYDNFPQVSPVIRMCKSFGGGIEFVEQPKGKFLTPYSKKTKIK